MRWVFVQLRQKIMYRRVIRYQRVHWVASFTGAKACVDACRWIGVEGAIFTFWFPRLAGQPAVSSCRTDTDKRVPQKWGRDSAVPCKVCRR